MTEKLEEIYQKYLEMPYADRRGREKIVYKCLKELEEYHLKK